MNTCQIENARDLILATIPSTVILVDDQGYITEWNRAAEQIFGIPADAVIGKSLGQTGIDWDAHRVMDGIHTALRKRRPQQLDEVRYVRTAGKSGILGLTAVPVLGEQQQNLGCIVLGAEITERKSLESQLAHAQKMESIGQLAAGIAHEINTPIQYVGDNLRFLQEAIADLVKMLDAYAEAFDRFEGGGLVPERLVPLRVLAEELDLDYLHDEIPRAIHQSLQGVEHVANIVRAMKQFSHPGTQDKKAADLNAAIASTVTVSRNEWKYVADVELDLDPGLPPVPCLLGDFNQMMLNIIVNAAHAIAEKLGKASQDKGKIFVSTRRDGDWVEIRVRDTGNGIPERIRTRVFDPFFTTKEVGKGTGQGLAIAYSTVVEKHAGTIHFETKEGEGTTFIIRLPIAESEA